MWSAIIKGKWCRRQMEGVMAPTNESVWEEKQSAEQHLKVRGKWRDRCFLEVELNAVKKCDAFLNAAHRYGRSDLRRHSTSAKQLRR